MSTSQGVNVSSQPRQTSISSNREWAFSKVSAPPGSNNALGPAIFSPCLRHILRLLAPKNDHEQRPRRACAVRIQEEGIINTKGEGGMGEEESPRVCEDTWGRW